MFVECPQSQSKNEHHCVRSVGTPRFLDSFENESMSARWHLKIGPPNVVDKKTGSLSTVMPLPFILISGSHVKFPLFESSN